MRDIPSSITSYLEGKTGLEQDISIEIEWEDNNWTTYRDEILSISTFGEKLTQLEKIASSVTITLEDCDDIIKNGPHYHKRRCLIYFNAVEDQFLLFSGQVSSPFQIQDKSITFDVLNEIETEELGFSPDEGQLDFVPNQFAAVVWPLGFGTVKMAPAVKVREPRSMTLSSLLTIIDPTLLYKMNAARTTVNFQIEAAFFWLKTLAMYEDEVGTLANEMANRMQASRAVMADVEELEKTYRLQWAAWIITRFGPLKALAKNARNAFLAGVQNNYVLNAMMNQLKADYVRVEELYEGCKFRREAAKKFLDMLPGIYESYRTYVKLSVDYCQQAHYQVNYLQVEDSSEFEQGVEQDFWIKNVRFTGSVTGNDLVLSSGPLPSYENVAVEEWAWDEEAICDPYHESFNMFRCLTDLRDQWILVRDVNGNHHILKVVKQVEDKVFYEIKEWDSNRIGAIDKMDMDKVIDRLVVMTAPPSEMYPTWPDESVFDAGYDPALWNMRETQRFLYLISLVSNPTAEEREALAKLAYLEPFDAISEANMRVSFPGPRQTFTIIGEDIEEVVSAAGTILPEWLTMTYGPFAYEEMPANMSWSAEPGTAVLEEQRCKIWIVNSLPSTIHGVYGYRTNKDGERFLAPYPKSFYQKLENKNLGTMNITALVFPHSVGGFEDSVFVTYTSSVGPRIVNIMKYLIDAYTDKTWDPFSFDYVEQVFQDKYPANFVLYSRVGVLDELQKIAWEARCRIFLRGDLFHLHYISERPSEVKIIEGGTIVANTTVHSTKETEEVYTKFTEIWKPNYLPTTIPRKLVIRYNLKRYGVREVTDEFHIFNNLNLVRKTAYFWAIRRSNSFKRIQVEVTLREIDLEVNDPVVFKDQLCIVSGVAYDRDKLIIDLDLPIRLGENEEYEYYWPSSIPPDLVFPPEDDQDSGRYGPHTFVTGDIPCP